MDPAGQQWLEQNVLPITRQAGFPDALVAGQWAIEGRKQNTSMFNMRFPNEGMRVHQYQNIQNNVQDYIRTVNDLLAKKGTSVQALGGDPEKILNAMQSTTGQRYEGDSQHPEDYLRIIKSTPEYQHYLQPSNQSSTPAPQIPRQTPAPQVVSSDSTPHTFNNPTLTAQPKPTTQPQQNPFQGIGQAAGNFMSGMKPQGQFSYGYQPSSTPKPQDSGGLVSPVPQVQPQGFDIMGALSKLFGGK